MGLLDRDLAFCYDYIRRLQEKGIQTMEFAQEGGVLCLLKKLLKVLKI